MSKIEPTPAKRAPSQIIALELESRIEFIEKAGGDPQQERLIQMLQKIKESSNETPQNSPNEDQAYSNRFALLKYFFPADYDRIKGKAYEFSLSLGLDPEIITEKEFDQLISSRRGEFKGEDSYLRTRQDIVKTLLSISPIEKPEWLIMSSNKTLRTRMSEKITEIKTWTDEAIIKEKVEGLPQPSQNLKYAIEIPVYKELSLEEKSRPNIISALESISKAALYVNVKGEEASKIEVLCNINNNEHPDEEARRQNQKTLQIIQALQVDKDIKQIEQDIIDLLHEDLESPRQTERYIRSAVSTIKMAIEKGLSIIAIDSTDGKYITRYNEQTANIAIRPSQASRSRLLQLAASHRFKLVNQKKGFHIRLDADSRLPKTFFSDMERESKASNDRAIIVFPRKFIEPTKPDQDFEQISPIHTEFIYNELFALLAKFNIYMHPRSIAAHGAIRILESIAKRNYISNPSFLDISPLPTLGNLAIPDKAMLDINGYPLYSSTHEGFGEDGSVIASLNEERYAFIHKYSYPILIEHRIRDESFMGQTEANNIHHRLEDQVFAPHARYATRELLSRWARKHSGEITPQNFPYIMFDFLESLDLKTHERRQLEIIRGAQSIEELPYYEVLDRLYSFLLIVYTTPNPRFYPTIKDSLKYFSTSFYEMPHYPGENIIKYKEMETI